MDSRQWTVDSGHLNGTPKGDTERGHQKGTKTLCVGGVPLPTGGFPFCFSLFAFFFSFLFLSRRQRRPRVCADYCDQRGQFFCILTC